jgi:23S rRNA (adenine2503-C2)-methyltransferase
MTQKNTSGEVARVKRNLLNMLPTEAEQTLRDFAIEHGEKPFRGSQVLRHLWQNPASSFVQMTDLPASFRALLDEHFTLPRLTLAMRQSSSDGTEKFLFRLDDGEFIETVAIPEGPRLTLCISSQAGCALQCAFCATGAMGFTRNLQMFEIAGQVREMKLLEPPKTVTNIVFMGMGEPLMNWKAVDPALTVLNSQAGLGSARGTSPFPRSVCCRESSHSVSGASSSAWHFQFTRRTTSSVNL